MKNIQGLKKVCIYDPATGDRVLLNYLSPDSTFNKEPIPTETGTGAILGGHSHTVDCIFFDLPDGARDQLEDWENDSTEINLVAITGTGVLLWYHPTTLSGFVDSLATNARDGVSPLNFTLEAHGFALDIYYGVNLLRAAMKRNEDGKTQYNATENYVPLRIIVPDSAERFRLNAFGRYVAGGDATPSQLRVVFPFDVTVQAGMVASGQFTIRTKTHTLSTVSEDDFDSDGFPNAFDTTGGYFLEIETPGNMLFTNLFIRTAGDAYING